MRVAFRTMIESRAAGLDQAGIEFIEDKNGERFVYDINGTTNYSSARPNLSRESSSCGPPPPAR